MLSRLARLFVMAHSLWQFCDILLRLVNRPLVARRVPKKRKWRLNSAISSLISFLVKLSKSPGCLDSFIVKLQMINTFSSSLQRGSS